MSESDDQERVVPDEERARALLEQLKSVHAVDIARDMAIAAVNFSYPKLGLSDETRAVRDLNDVRVSIELLRAILEVLDREHGGEVTSDLHDTLAQMQLAYAHAVQLAGAERAAQQPPSEAASAEPAAQPEAEDQGGSDEEGGAEPDEEPAAAQAVAEEAPETEDEPASETEVEQAPKKKPAARKPAAKKSPAAKKKSAPKKKPAGDS